MSPQRLNDTVTDFHADMTPNVVTGDIKKVSDIAAIKQHLELLLMSGENALIGRPGVCAGLRTVLFEIFGSHEKRVLKNKILEAVRHEPRVKLLDSDITIWTEDHDLSVSLKLTVIDTGQLIEYKQTLRRIL